MKTPKLIEQPPGISLVLIFQNAFFICPDNGNQGMAAQLLIPGTAESTVWAEASKGIELRVGLCG